MKRLVLLVMVMSANLSFASDEEFELNCVWQPSANHVQGFYVEGAEFTLNFQRDNESLTKVTITKDTFFNRTYTPCYTGGFASCMFAFSYNASQTWDADDETDILTQSWRQEFVTEYNDGLPEEAGTVDGVSTLKLDTSDEKGLVKITGDDGDGVTFSENFKCTLPGNPFGEFLGY